MVFLAFIEIVVVLLLLIVGITQVVIPLWNSRPLFPAFRDPGKVEHELGEVEEELHSLELEKEVMTKKKTIEEMKRIIHREDETDGKNS